MQTPLIILIIHQHRVLALTLYAILVAFSRYRAGTLEFLERIKRVSPPQRVAFVNGESLYLSPLFYNGKLIRKAEGPEDLIEQVGALLATG